MECLASGSWRREILSANTFRTPAIWHAVRRKLCVADSQNIYLRHFMMYGLREVHRLIDETVVMLSDHMTTLLFAH